MTELIIILFFLGILVLSLVITTIFCFYDDLTITDEEIIELVELTISEQGVEDRFMTELAFV